ncbi:MAG: histidinol dehydrogenase [Actinomycetota bacterium]|jgi:histidinol dehydrogenase
MIQIIDVREISQISSPVVPRAQLDVDSALIQINPVLADVEKNGDNAVLSWNEKFDGIRPKSLRVPQEVIDKAFAEMSPDVIEALKESIKRTTKVHESQLKNENKTTVVENGFVTQKYIPVSRVGLYVPGGKAVYPSSVVMNVVPAKVAGVKSIAVSSPSQKENDGWPHKTILAACKLLEIDEVYSAGGAQAIAMFAYGTKSCKKVNLITGPGNVYVTAAKRKVRSVVAIDSEAGPTEIAILADETGNAEWIAADLISQAEHDVIASSILVTNSIELSNQVKKALEIQVPQTKHSDRIKQALLGKQSAIVLVNDIEQGIEVINDIASEHLEIHTKDLSKVVSKIENAGAIFVGPNTPVSLGDYLAGSNHVLPTGGCACHSSGLNVQTFLKSVQVIEYSKEALLEASNHVRALAHAEDLPAHAQAIDIRLENNK